ncbi:protein adenylyltransferase SelO [Rivibacter subsaxonicus]|nr:YdiU family protein [Rivibacter subsaxonicus]
MAALGPAFGTALAAEPLPDPHWVARNDALAAELGWPADWHDGSALAVLSGNATWPGMSPFASVYSGHQFGVWAGQLGDGRALLLGEIESAAGPMEIQLKGSGLTPYSRMGDGRAVLRSSIREYLCSEAMHGLGIPSTRALALTGSQLPVRRERWETAAVVTRMAPSFLRFGHFEHFAHTARDLASLQRLVDFSLANYFPDCLGAAQPAAAMLSEVARRTAELIAQWQAVGFCHGVMNTDNMSLLGLTIDYGPFGFLDGFDPGHVCNHSDHQGRYAYARQPGVAWWNLQALATALLPQLGADEDAASEAALEAIEPYRSALSAALSARMRAKFGLATEQPDDATLIDDLLRLMAAERTDYTILFRHLSGFSTAPDHAQQPVRDLFIDRPAFDAWAGRYAERLRTEQSDDAERAVRMNSANPKFVLRNHLAQSAIEAAEAGDFDEIGRLMKVLARPYDEQATAPAAYAAFPPPGADQIEVSCSS